MSKADRTANRLTVLTTLGRIRAVKTYRKEDEKIIVEGYGKPKRFHHREVPIDGKGEWLRELGRESQSFVVLGEVKDKDEEIIYRRTQDREDGRADLKDVPRLLMPLDIDHLDIDLSTVCDINDGERIAKEILRRLGIAGTRCVCHFTNSHGFDDRYRVRLWIELEEATTARRMREWAEAKWDLDNFGVDVLDAKGKKVRKRIVDLSVLQPQQPVYTGDPILEGGIRSPVKNRVFPVKGRPLALGALPRKAKRQNPAGEAKDANIAKIKKAGLYIEQQSPGHHFMRCPWEDEHSGEERKDDTIYHEPNYGGHDHPTFKCHHETHKDKFWSDVEEWIDGQIDGDDDSQPKWVYVARHERFWDARDGALVTHAAYAARIGCKRDEAVTRFRKKGGRVVDDARFAPGRDRFFTESKLDLLNIYVEQRIAPNPKIDATPWVEHLEWLIPSREDREHQMDWLAWCYQHPGRKITWAPILYGPPGTGKTTVFNCLAQCLGPVYMSEPTQSELEDKFNDWAFGKLLVKIEELMSGDRYHVAEKLKPVVANPTLSIRQMHKTGFVVTNVANVCASTNHMQALPIEKGDRRYMLIECRDERDEDERKRHMRALHAWLEQVGHGGIAHWLATRDVSEFLPTTEAPMTRLKQVVAEASKTDMDHAVDLCEAFDKGDFVSSGIVAKYLVDNGCTISDRKLGLIAAKRKWGSLPGDEGRASVGGRRLTFWVTSRLPSQGRTALKRFLKLPPSERERAHNNMAARLVFGPEDDDDSERKSRNLSVIDGREAR